MDIRSSTFIWPSEKFSTKNLRNLSMSPRGMFLMWLSSFSWSHSTRHQCMICINALRSLFVILINVSLSNLSRNRNHAFLRTNTSSQSCISKLGFDKLLKFFLSMIIKNKNIKKYSDERGETPLYFIIPSYVLGWY